MSEQTAPPPGDKRPLLVYDGDCGFCYYWMSYWRALTGDRVRYAPYQDEAANYPQIPLEAFKHGVQYIAPDGAYVGNAAASFLTLAHAPGKYFWWWLYKNVPGFAYFTELAYEVISAHRALFYRTSLLLWGRNYEPPQYEAVTWFFLRLMGLIYFSAFVSFAVQAQGLIGSHGILPLAPWIDALNARVGIERYYLLPMVFWFDASDTAIQIVCWGGAAVSLLLTFNLLPRTSLSVLYLLYLSLFYGGQTFMTFQWDIFLLEMGFLSIVLTFARMPGIWLLRWLMFRFMFMSGMVKLLSGDANWWNLSALSYHFLTQPLPTPVAWYAAQLPAGFLKFSVAAVFVIELVLPFLIFTPRRLRFIAAFGFLILEALILLTGNYNWFNLQTMVLCLPLFDDAALRRTLPKSVMAFAARHTHPVRRTRGGAYVAGALCVLIVFCGFVEMDRRFGVQTSAPARFVDELVQPLHIVSGYGLFSVMTTMRNEIVIEGSDDGTNWREYEFPYKPGDVTRAPWWNIPHQPRLDWQMWFAALDDPKNLPWFRNFLARLLQNEPDVLALLAKNPFPGRAPTYVRAQFYNYIYATPAEVAQGIWWKRRPLGLYYPISQLQKPN